MDKRRAPEHAESESAIEREIRQGRAFSLGDAIARAAGPGVMKGESPVSRVRQAEVEIQTWLRDHLADAGGPLEIVLGRHVVTSELMLENPEQPLVVLGDYCRRVLASDGLLEELVRDADLEWGRRMGERPYFEKAGTPAHADDPYTIALIRKTLAGVLEQLAANEQ